MAKTNQQKLEALDETRRLLLMLQVAKIQKKIPSVELIGSLANSLVFHLELLDDHRSTITSLLEIDEDGVDLLINRIAAINA